MSACFVLKCLSKFLAYFFIRSCGFVNDFFPANSIYSFLTFDGPIQSPCICLNDRCDCITFGSHLRVTFSVYLLKILPSFLVFGKSLSSKQETQWRCLLAAYITAFFSLRISAGLTHIALAKRAEGSDQ